jgi:hypothetical protein
MNFWGQHSEKLLWIFDDMIIWNNLEIDIFEIILIWHLHSWTIMIIFLNYWNVQKIVVFQIFQLLFHCECGMIISSSPQLMFGLLCSQLCLQPFKSSCEQLSLRSLFSNQTLRLCPLFNTTLRGSIGEEVTAAANLDPTISRDHDTTWKIWHLCNDAKIHKHPSIVHCILSN